MKQHLNDAELQLYLDGRLEEREKLDHLRGCPLCQERLDGYEPLFAALAVEPEWSPSPALTEKVMRKIRRESLGPLSENLLHSLILMGGIIAAFRIALPFLHPRTYLTEMRGLRLPESGLSWEWFRHLNILPQLEEYFRGTTLPINSLVLLGGALLLVLLLDQLIALARRHDLPQSR
ncbi:MAG TPA: hypothetical protein PLN61_02880 [bacterium]|nr:hypothetical protein [bacterium]HQI47584.1 hypothetical protein [bacterium]HQJ64362.1 hypothetical protein [bacterium]HQJ65474.1 hypothetical protein [bacterium]